MAELNGFIKLHRSLLNWRWFSDTNTLSVFVFCLLNASFKEGNWRGVEYKKGQLITSLPSIAEKTGLSIQSVRTALKHLKSTGELTDKSYNKFRIITVNNFEKYQELTGKATDNQQTTNRQLTDNQQHIKNDKNVNNVKNIYNSKDKSNNSSEQNELVAEQAVISLLLNDNSLFHVLPQKVSEWKDTYPNVDVVQELKKMSVWLNANPKRRKTNQGIERFVINWLSKAQYKGDNRTTVDYSDPNRYERMKGMAGVEYDE